MKHHDRSSPVAPAFEAMEPRVLLSADAILTEFMAINTETLADSFGQYPDWIEVHNPGAAPLNLDGWRLRDSANEWIFPARTLAAGEYLVVFASGRDLRDPAGELHTNFSLKGEGEYLALLRPDATPVTEFSPYPPQADKVSYGLFHVVETQTLVYGSSDGYGRTLVPTDAGLGLDWTGQSATFDDSLWTYGPLGVGYERDPAPALVAGFLVRMVDVNGGTDGDLNHIGEAVTLLDGGAAPGAYLIFSDTTVNRAVVNYGLGGGVFAGDLLLPNGFGTSSDSGVHQREQYALRATATVTIPEGQWSIAVGSDDGFRLTIPGVTFLGRYNEEFTGAANPSPADTLVYGAPRGHGQTWATFTVGAGGLTTTLQLDFYERGGGDSVELSIASGHRTSFNTTDFTLLLDGAKPSGAAAAWAVKEPYLAVPNYAHLIGTNVEAQAYGVNASVYLRVPFTVADPSVFEGLTLRMKYDDGFVAYINGHEVASRNAPASPAWNASATAERDDALAMQWETIDVSAGLPYLRAGANVLAIHGLNFGASDPDLLVLPELVATDDLGRVPRYFATPSPRAANLDAFVAFVADTTFSADRGFYFGPFDVAIACATPDATIRYTTDGRTPTETTGTLYTGPVRISGTTVLRAVAYKAGWRSSDVDTQTYLFVEDVLFQSPDGAAPAGWPTGPVNGQILDYGVDPDVVQDPRYTDQMVAALLDLPSLSLVTDLANLFDPSMGIYVNAGQEGRAWERAASLELLQPDGAAGFQVNAGLRIRGGYSRSGNNPKHGWRLFFRSDYGDAKLRFPLFGDEGVDKFDHIDLRTTQNYSWAFEGDSRNTFLRDVFSRDLQRDMGQPYTRSRYYHLYLNGQYWGVYQTQERSEASYGETYFGGGKEEYDVIKAEAGPYVTVATDGDLTAWTEFYNLAVAGFATNEAYYRAQGLNPDGTRNPDYPVHLDVDNLIDYMIGTLYVGDRDAPVSNFLSNLRPNNFYGMRNRNGQQGWQFFRHDGEHTLNTGLADRTGPWLAGDPTNSYGGLATSNPQYIHQRLAFNAEYRMRFADRVHEYFFNGGALTQAAVQARLLARADEIDLAIIAESARWGDAKVAKPRTKDDDWWPAVNAILNWVSGRVDTVLTQLRNYNEKQDKTGAPQPLYSSVVAPTFNQHGGSVPTGFGVTMTAPAGTLYYTLDGSDPRLPGGGVSPAALVYGGAVTLTDNRWVKARALSGGTWSALNQAAFVVADPPALRITEIMYHAADPPEGSPYTVDDFGYVEVQNIGAAPLDITGFRFTRGIGFTFPTMTLPAGGRALVVRNQAALESRWGTGLPVAGEFTGTLALGGERLRLECRTGTVIHDFEYQDGWFPHTDGEGFSLVVRDAAQALDLWGQKDGWQASWVAGGSPGVAESASAVSPGTVLINEVLAHTDGADGDWIEFYNPTGSPVVIGGWYLSDDPANLLKYRIAPGTVVPPNGYRVLTQAAHFGGAFALSELGEGVYLSSSPAEGVLGGYRESETFGASDREVTFGRYIKSTGGKDFVPLSAATRGSLNAAPLVGPVVLGEILYNPAPGGDEFIELVNLTAAPVPLYDPLRPANTWKFTDGITFAFPVGATIAANGYALVVPIDPAAFRAKYAVAADVPIFGPYTGALDNGGEPVEVSRPGDPEPVTGFVPYYRVDRVNYDDDPPWPTVADGSGPSLIRLAAGQYGNDVANWAAGKVGGTPGAANVALDASPPTVPTGLGASVGGPGQVLLAWTPAEDPQTGVALYRVYRNGFLIGTSATASFTDAYVRAAYNYSYQVAAVNADLTEGGRSDPVPVRLVALTGASSSEPTVVRAVFTDALDRDTAQETVNYAVTDAGGQPIGVLEAVLQPDLKTVLLTLAAPLAQGPTYTLAAGAIRSRAGMWVAPNSAASFTYVPRITQGVFWEYWLGIGGTAVTDLTGNANYPNNPTGRAERSLFEGPVNWADSYGSRIRAYVIAPATGQYTFWIASDDNSELYLSLSEDPAAKTRIARVTSWTDSRQWTKFTSQKSALITLQAGQRYYIEAIQKEGGGGDNLAVGWQLPDMTLERPIPANRLVPYYPTPATTVSVQATTALAHEAAEQKGRFTLSRTGSTAGALTVYYTITGTARSTDLREDLIGTAVIPAGASSIVLDVTPVDDADNEADETIRLSIVADPNFNYALGTAVATVTIVDNEYPTLVGVALNGLAGRGPSGIDPSGRGIQTVDVLFSEPVTFAAGDVRVQTVTFPGGVETVMATLTPASVTGTGTATMRITLPGPVPADTWVKVTVRSDGTLRDLTARLLDGEPRAGGTSLGYIYDGAADLPTGNGTPGGDAVFYVGSLRGDFDGDRGLTVADVTAFEAAYSAASPDADFRGIGFGAAGPDGLVTRSDVAGFVAAYQAGVAANRRLDPLPGTGGGAGPLAAGATGAEPLAASVPVAVTAELDGAVDVLRWVAPEPVAVAADAAATEGAWAADGAGAGEALTVAGGGETPGTAAAEPVDAAPMTAAGKAAVPVLEADGGMVDALAGDALDVPLTA